MNRPLTHEEFIAGLPTVQRIKALRSQIWCAEREALEAQERARRLREELARLQEPKA